MLFSSTCQPNRETTAAPHFVQSCSKRPNMGTNAEGATNLPTSRLHAPPPRRTARGSGRGTASVHHVDDADAHGSHAGKQGHALDRALPLDAGSGVRALLGRFVLQRLGGDFVAVRRVLHGSFRWSMIPGPNAGRGCGRRGVQDRFLMTCTRAAAPGQSGGTLAPSAPPPSAPLSLRHDCCVPGRNHSSPQRKVTLNARGEGGIGFRGGGHSADHREPARSLTPCPTPHSCLV
jgi:hypothetical protein